VDAVRLPADDPLQSFEAWYRSALEGGVALPEAVCLATAAADAAPSARMVLFRGIERGRFLFFTDYRSRKARELDANPRAALVFHWQAIQRQVRVEGTVERLAGADSDRYFLSRHRGSRISAWASQQSAPVEDRETLERRRIAIERRFRDREVTRPESWGGYGLLPSRVEFWIGREHRLHDRLAFDRTNDGWHLTVLQP
jgi:pyridoxamine 5'-phosphate oxidase